MLHFMGTFLISLVLCQSQGVSDNDTIRIFCRLCGSVPIVMQRGVRRCVAIATGVEHPVVLLLLLLFLGILVGVEAEVKALWVETFFLVQAMCRPRFRNRVSCLLEVRQVLGSELHRKVPILLCWPIVGPPVFKNTTKIQRKRPKEREKRMKTVAGEEKKKARNFGPPPFEAPPFGAPTLRGPHPSGPPPFGGPTLRGGPPFWAPMDQTLKH